MLLAGSDRRLPVERNNHTWPRDYLALIAQSGEPTIQIHIARKPN